VIKRDQCLPSEKIVTPIPKQERSIDKNIFDAFETVNGWN